MAAYDALAPVYDEFTSGHRYDEWTRDLESLARAHGLRGRRLLDVACGTGKSFIPFLARGYSVTACDLSPAMLARARTKRAAAGARLHLADMRELPGPGGRFDLVTCIDDGLNHLLTDADLRTAFGEAHRQLAAGGLYLFDLNSLRTYRSVFCGAGAVDTPGGRFELAGEAAPDSPAGAVCAVTISGVVAGGSRSTSRHLQRHHPRATVQRLLEQAGLECLAVHGQRADGAIDPSFEELTHTKSIWLARRPVPEPTERR
ncbi:MAG: hypothetical protein QOH58_3055 [Thermoleophilaceae bacterium]|nr:hypothetical protein [Thermoleophilaceae bacterium]